MLLVVDVSCGSLAGNGNQANQDNFLYTCCWWLLYLCGTSPGSVYLPCLAFGSYIYLLPMVY